MFSKHALIIVCSWRDVLEASSNYRLLMARCSRYTIRGSSLSIYSWYSGFIHSKHALIIVCSWRDVLEACSNYRVLMVRCSRYTIRGSSLSIYSWYSGFIHSKHALIIVCSWRDVLDTPLGDQVYQFTPGTPVLFIQSML